METKTTKGAGYGELPAFFNLDSILEMPDDTYIKMVGPTLYQTSPTVQLIADRYCQLAYRDFTLHLQVEDKKLVKFHNWVVNKINSKEISLDGEKNLREIIQSLGMTLLQNGNAVWRIVQDEGTRLEIIPMYHYANSLNFEYDKENNISNRIVYNKKTHRHFGYKFDDEVEPAYNEIYGKRMRTNMLIRHSYRDLSNKLSCQAPILKLSKRAGYVDRVTQAISKNTLLQNKIALYIHRQLGTIGQSTPGQDLFMDQKRINEENGVDQSRIDENYKSLGSGGIVEGLLAGEEIKTIQINAIGSQLVENFINKQLQLCCNTLSLPFEHFMMSYDSSYAASMNIDVLLRDFIADAWRNLNEPIRQLIRILSLEYGQNIDIEKYLANLKINSLSKSMGDISKSAKAYAILDSIGMLDHKLAWESIYNSPPPADIGSKKVEKED